MNNFKNSFATCIVIALLAIAMPCFSQPNWTVNPGDFEYNMNVFGVAYVLCQETVDDNDMIAAFVGEEIRGVQFFNVHSNLRNYAYLFVFSNSFSGDTVRFKFYDASEDTILEVNQYVTFLENQIYGSDAMPFIYTTKNDPLELKLESDKLSRTHQVGTLVSTLKVTNTIGDNIFSTFEWINDADGAGNHYFEIKNQELYLKESVSNHIGDTVKLHVKIKSSGNCTTEQLILLVLENITTTYDSGDQINFNIEIFPNPASDYFTVKSSTTFDHVIIFDPIQSKLWEIEMNKRIVADAYFSRTYYLIFQKGKQSWMKPLLVLK